MVVSLLTVHSTVLPDSTSPRIHRDKYPQSSLVAGSLMYHIVLSSCIYTCTHNDTRVGQKETLVHTSQIGEQIQQKLILLSFLIPCIRSQDIKHVSIDDHITFIRLLTECKYWLKIHFLNRIQISQDTVNSLNTNVNNPQQFHKRHVKNTLSICTANMLQ